MGLSAAPPADVPVPVTVLTGWLGAGKTTLLNRILGGDHGRRYAVVVNEFGAVGIDHELLVGADEELFELNNGCVCCTVRGDLIRTLHTLLAHRQRFDAVIVETTGLADPGPVAQTFFVDPVLRERTRLDAVVTVVDAHHVLERLADSAEAVEQIAFADQIVLNKTDLVDTFGLQRVRERLTRLNSTAQVHVAQRGDVPLDRLLGHGGFDLDRLEASRLELHPQCQPPSGVAGSCHVHGLNCAHDSHDPDHAHHDHGLATTDTLPASLHDHDIRSIVLRAHRPLDGARVQAWLTNLVRTHGANILRAKGILDIAGDPRRMVFQSVHMVMEGDWQRLWKPDDERYSRVVLIGRHLQDQAWQAALQDCVA
ncbi:MAG: CobW family GTP-binding protein [Rubrivivax sp.]